MFLATEALTRIVSMLESTRRYSSLVAGLLALPLLRLQPSS